MIYTLKSKTYCKKFNFLIIMLSISTIVSIIGIYKDSMLIFLAGLSLFLLSFTVFIPHSFDPFSPYFISFSTFCFAYIVKIFFPISTPYSYSNLMTAYLAVLIFVIGWVFGTMYGTMLYKLKIIKSKILIELPSGIYKMQFFFLLLGIFMWIYLVKKSGLSMYEVLRNPLMFRWFSFSGFNYYIVLVMKYFLTLSVTIEYLSILKENVNKRSSYLFWFFTFCTSLLIMYTLGSRGVIITMLLVPLIVYHMYKKKIKIRTIILLAIFIIPFMVIYQQMRDFAAYQTVFKIPSVLEMLKLLIARFDAFPNLTLFFSNFKEPWLFGKSFINFLLQPIPRTLYPDKPLLFSPYISKLITPYLFENNITLTFSIMAEWYANFGWLGILFGGFIFGIIIYIAQNYYNNNNKSIFFIIFYVTIFTTPQAWLLADPINGIGNVELIFNSVMMLILLFVVNIFSKKHIKC